MTYTPTLVLVGILLVFLGTVASTAAGGPMNRVRVERFAIRQRLVVTEENGNQVIRYLACVRRWRVAGLAGGFLATMLTAPAGTIVRVEAVPLFAGWFLGALIAEVRVAHLAHGAVRIASLQPRRPGAYLGPFAWGVVPATAAVAVAVGAGTAVGTAIGWSGADWTAWAWLVVAVALAVAVRLIQHAVLGRPQPHAAPDVLAADDAIRSRSLHVLAGGGAALILIVVLQQLGAAQAIEGSFAQSLIEVARVLGVYPIAIAGWTVATATWPPHRHRPGTAGAAAIGAP